MFVTDVKLLFYLFFSVPFADEKKLSIERTVNGEEMTSSFLNTLYPLSESERNHIHVLHVLLHYISFMVATAMGLLLPPFL